jgi:hypothetical protein
MRIVNESGTFFLDENGLRVSISSRELSLFKDMNPMGRKLALRKRAVDKILSCPDDPEIRLILSLSRLPASEWSFPVPD